MIKGKDDEDFGANIMSYPGDDTADGNVAEPTKEDKEALEDVTLEDLEGKRDDFEMGVDYGLAGKPKEEEEEEIVEKKKEEKVEDKSTSDKQITDDQKAIEQVLGLLGADATFKIKGKQYLLKDLPKEEVHSYLQKGLAFYKEMEGVANQRKEIETREKALSQRAGQLEEIIRQQQKAKEKQDDFKLHPELFEVSETDTPSDVLLKKTLSTIVAKVSDLERGQQEVSTVEHEKTLLAEIESYMKDYPVASREEVIAFKIAYPDIPTERIIQKSHEHYSSGEHIRACLAANPGFARELAEEIVTAHLAKKQEAGRKVVSRRPASSTALAKAEGTKPKIQSFSDAEAEALRLLREIRQSAEE